MYFEQRLFCGTGWVKLKAMIQSEVRRTEESTILARAVGMGAVEVWCYHPQQTS